MKGGLKRVQTETEINTDQQPRQQEGEGNEMWDGTRVG